MENPNWKETDAPQKEEPKQPYVPRPKYQIVIAWILLVLLIVGIVLWLLEIGTAGSLFGWLDR